DRAAGLLTSMEEYRAAEMLVELASPTSIHSGAGSEWIPRADPRRAAEMLAAMSAGEAADMLTAMEQEVAEGLMTAMPAGRADEVLAAMAPAVRSGFSRR